MSGSGEYRRPVLSVILKKRQVLCKIKLLQYILFSGVLLSFNTSYAEAANKIHFKKIADTNTPIPKGLGNFKSFSSPSISHGNVVFYSYGSKGQIGIYSYTNNGLEVVADKGDNAPGGGVFENFSSPSISGESIVFRGISKKGSVRGDGFYLKKNEVIDIVVDNNTVMPDSGYKFDLFLTASISENTVVFRAYGSGEGGVYKYTDKIITPIADKNTSIPDAEGSFSDHSRPSISKGVVAFSGYNRNISGIYIKKGGVLNTVADTNTKIPGGNGLFSDFAVPSNFQGSVLFWGKGGKGQEGIYVSKDGVLSTVVNTMTNIPGGSGKFEGFHSFPSISKNAAVFLGVGDGKSGIYAKSDKGLQKIIDISDTLNGKQIKLFNLGTPASFNAESSDGNQIVFVVNFTDGSKGIYMAEILD